MKKFLIWQENYYAIHGLDDCINNYIFNAIDEISAYKKYCEKENLRGNDPDDSFVISLDEVEIIKNKKLSYIKEDIEICKTALMFSCNIVKRFDIVQIEPRITNEENYSG